MTSVTCPLGSFKTYRIHGLIKPSKHAQRHRLYEERRRCDNINEEIQELSHLVPMHRLEDEKARRHILNNPPLSPILAARIQNELPMCAFSNLLIYINKYGMSRGYGFVRFSDEGDQQHALQSGASDFLASRSWLTCNRRWQHQHGNTFRGERQGTKQRRHLPLPPKVVRSAAHYTETAVDEIKLLNKIVAANPNHPGRKHVVSLLDSF